MPVGESLTSIYKDLKSHTLKVLELVLCQLEWYADVEQSDRNIFFDDSVDRVSSARHWASGHLLFAVNLLNTYLAK